MTEPRDQLAAMLKMDAHLDDWAIPQPQVQAAGNVRERMEAIMRDFKPVPARTLHCGEAVWDQLRERAPKTTETLGMGAAFGGMPLDGIPVHVDRKMRAGRWELREGDEVIHSGDITPDPAAFYVPGLGFIKFNINEEF